MISQHFSLQTEHNFDHKPAYDAKTSTLDIPNLLFRGLSTSPLNFHWHSSSPPESLFTEIKLPNH
uniref:50S ribosomal protein L10 n=1 Tax=Arundo donax TaxID=35708 RepID=A0A0A9EYM3_ARUDO